MGAMRVTSSPVSTGPGCTIPSPSQGEIFTVQSLRQDPRPLVYLRGLLSGTIPGSHRLRTRLSRGRSKCASVCRGGKRKEIRKKETIQPQPSECQMPGSAPAQAARETECLGEQLPSLGEHVHLPFPCHRGCSLVLRVDVVVGCSSRRRCGRRCGSGCWCRLTRQTEQEMFASPVRMGF